MKDYYVHADNLEEMKASLAPLGLVTEGEFLTASADHALDYIGTIVSTPAEIDEEGEEVSPAVFHPGVYAALRVQDETLAAQVESAGLNLVEKPQGARSWAC